MLIRDTFTFSLALKWGKRHADEFGIGGEAMHGLVTFILRQRYKERFESVCERNKNESLQRMFGLCSVKEAVWLYLLRHFLETVHTC